MSKYLEGTLNQQEKSITGHTTREEYLEILNNRPTREKRALIMKSIILSFMQLLDIDENGVINNKKNR